MKNETFTRGEIALAACAVAAALALPHAAVAADKAKNKAAGTYVTGDFHNHTTCSDGSISLKKLIDKSVRQFNLDWFVQTDHGGSSARNCTLAEDPLEPVAPALGLTNSSTGPWPPSTFPTTGQPAASGKGPNQPWQDTLPGGVDAIKGTNNPVANSNVPGKKAMWRWQEIKEYMYPVAEAESRARGKPVWLGLEQNAPGHEHISTTVLKGQLPWPSAGVAGNATLQAQYEYCFDRSDTDTSRGAENQWNCSVTGSTAGNALIDATAAKITGTNSSSTPDLGHTKTLEGIKWMAEKAPGASYFIPAHLERAGPYDASANKGYNIEHLRDFNNTAPTIAFGFESMPGHQAAANRGEYGPTVTGGVAGGFANSVGGGTYGGTGIYAAQIGGVWDALLGEGRNWWFFGSSDYHNRGSFGPDQRESNQDLQPGEYTKDYVMVRRGSNNLSAEGIVDGLRSGNSFVANGDLIDRLAFVVCARNAAVPSSAFKALMEKAALNAVAKGGEVRIDGCATMGEKLVARSGAELWVAVAVRDPQGTNNSPYSFPNPSLKQIGITQPLNAPVLDHIDVIGGNVTGYVDPASASYKGTVVKNDNGSLTPVNNTGGARNDSAGIRKTFNSTSWTAQADGVRVMSYKVSNVTASQYFRLRGTNLPPATPYETDANGNPLLDFLVAPSDQSVAGNVPCGDAACPAHLRTVNGVKYSSFDVAAWADLWFYSNPVFVEVIGGTRVAGVR